MNASQLAQIESALNTAERLADKGWAAGIATTVDRAEIAAALALVRKAQATSEDVAEAYAAGLADGRRVGAQAVEAPRMTDAARDVLAERKRQIEREGWTPEHDDEHTGSELAMAASVYAAHASAALHIEAHAGTWLDAAAIRMQSAQEFVRRSWPWDREWWKPKDNRRNLIRAAALILAEIERLDRRSASAPAAPDCAEPSRVDDQQEKPHG